MLVGVLISVIIASIFAYEFAHLSDNEKIYREEIDKAQIAQFNSRFEKYSNKEEITAQDIVTLVGYVEQWNNQSSENEKVNVRATAALHTELYKYINKIGIYRGDTKIRDSEFLAYSGNHNTKYICELEYETDAGGRVKTVTFRYK